MIKALAPRASFIAALLACSVTVYAQAPSPPIVPTNTKKWTYDVVSVKPNKSDDNRMMIRMLPNGVAATNVSVAMLLQNAYGIKPDLISGLPNWTENAKFDVEAKVSADDADAFSKLPREERSAAGQKMMQAVLADRFKLTARVETKELPVFDLVVAKGGPKLTPSPTDDADPTGVKGPDGNRAKNMLRYDGNTFTAQGIGMASFANNLAFQAHRTVIDKTGLTGHFDFTLKFTRETGAPPGPDSGTNDDAPSLFAALEEQLGLKLVNSKGPVDTLTVEHVEQPT